MAQSEKAPSSSSILLASSTGEAQYFLTVGIDYEILHLIMQEVLMGTFGAER